MAGWQHRKVYINNLNSKYPMTQLKHTIIYMIVFCLIFLGLSYLVSVNKELVFYSANSAWISNDFLLSCFTGIFASLMVLITTELYKFFQMKRSMEQWFFMQMATIYGQLHIAETNIRNLLSSKESIPTNLLHYLSNIIKQLTPAMRVVDYNPLFETKNTKTIVKIIKRLHSVQLNNLESLANDCIYLEMAVCTDKIKEHEKGALTPVITFVSPNTNRTLIALLNEIQNTKSQMTINIAELNAACYDRFKWSEVNSQISAMPTIDTSLEGFWARWEKAN